MNGSAKGLPPAAEGKFVVLIGLMGVGKSNVGRRLADLLRLPFVDTDTEIEDAAGRSIEDIFEEFGEPYFRDGERKVISRLLDGPQAVMATGGGSYMDPDTRRAIQEKGISIWLRADLDLLVKRTKRRDNRPLLKQGDRRDTLAQLIAKRYPVYGEADIIIDVAEESAEETTQRVLEALQNYQPAEAD